MEAEAPAPRLMAAIGFALLRIEDIQRSVFEHGNVPLSESITRFLREHGQAYFSELTEAEARALVEQITHRILSSRSLVPEATTPAPPPPPPPPIGAQYLDKAFRSCLAYIEVLQTKVVGAQTLAGMLRQSSSVDTLGEIDNLSPVAQRVDEIVLDRQEELRMRVEELQRCELPENSAEEVRAALATLGTMIEEELGREEMSYARALTADMLQTCQIFARSQLVAVQQNPAAGTDLYLRGLQASPLPVFALDRNGSVTLWNERMATWTNVAATRAVAGQFVDLVHDSAQASIVVELGAAMREGRRAVLEIPFLSEGGSSGVTRARVSFSCLSAGVGAGTMNCGMLGIAAEAARAGSDDEDDAEDDDKVFSRILEGANAPALILDPDGRIRFWNENLAQRTGLAASNAVGEKLLDFVPEESKKGAQEVLQNAYIGIESSNCIINLKSLHGGGVPIAFSIRCLRSRSGPVRKIICVGQDFSTIYTFRGRMQNRESEFSRLIRTSNAPVFCVDNELRIVEWNDKSERITGFSREDALSKQFEDFMAVDTEEVSKLTQVLRGALHGYETEDYECSLKSKSGEDVHIVINAAARRDVNGTIFGVFCVGQDVSEIIRHRNESIQRAEEFRNLIAVAPSPIFCVDTERRVTQWNAKLEAMSGYLRHECLGELIGNLVDEADRSKLQECLDKALREEPTGNLELTLTSKDGVARCVLLNVTVTRRNNAVSGVVGIGQDISQLRSLSDQQKLLVEDLTRLINTANAPIFGIDRSMNVTEWNLKAEALSGYSKAEALGSPFLRFVHDLQKNAVRSILENALRGRDTANYQFALETKGKGRRQVLFNATSRLSQSGDIVGVVGVGQDITDRVELEQARQRQHKERARANAEVEFTRFLAHEVRNPLSGIDSCAQFLDEYDLSTLSDDVRESVKSDLGHIRACVSYMTRVMDDTLELGKIAANSIVLKSECVSLGAVLEECDRMARRDLREGVDMRWELENARNGDMLVMSDPLRLQQIVANVLANAVKFTTEGSIRVKCSRLAPDAVLITVQDTGPGIPLSQQQYLFSKYRRGAGMRKTGLGLTVCFELVNIMGGDVSVDKTYSQGTRIKILLPLMEVLAPAPAPNHVTLEPASLPCRLRCLVCDDSIGARKVLRRRLRRLTQGWEFHEVESGEEALEKTKTLGFDIIFMDENMDQSGGVMVGHEVCGRLRAQRFEGLIIGVSGDHHQEAFMANGATLSWTKPLPKDRTIVQDLMQNLKNLPGCLTALIVDDIRVTRKVVSSRLARMGHNSWSFLEAGSVGDAIDIFENSNARIDLIVVDEDFGAGSTRGEDFIRYVRDGLHSAAIILGLTGHEEAVERHYSAGADLCWLKPFPSDERLSSELAPLLRQMLPTKAPIPVREDTFSDNGSG